MFDYCVYIGHFCRSWQENSDSPHFRVMYSVFASSFKPTDTSNMLMVRACDITSG